MTKLEFTPGEKYQTRGGEPAFYVGAKANGWHVFELLKRGGLFSVNDDGESYYHHPTSNLDIIGPYREPLQLKRGTVLPWFWGVAMDKDGKWFMYSKEPSKCNAVWIGDHPVPLPPEYAPKNYTGAWQDSATPIDQIEWVDQ